MLTVQGFTDEEEALALSDHQTYGLAAGLFTRDLARSIRITRRLQAATSGSTATAAPANRKSKSVLINLQDQT